MNLSFDTPGFLLVILALVLVAAYLLCRKLELGVDQWFRALKSSPHRNQIKKEMERFEQSEQAAEDKQAAAGHQDDARRRKPAYLSISDVTSEEDAIGSR